MIPEAGATKEKTDVWTTSQFLNVLQFLKSERHSLEWGKYLQSTYG